MRSSSFPDITSPLMTAMDRPRRLAKGGHARGEAPHHGALRHLTIVMGAPSPAETPSPILGALMQAVLLHQIAAHQKGREREGALSHAMHRRRR